MGRKLKYDTDKKRKESKRKDNKLYYERHKEEIKRKRMEYYWRTKVDKDMSKVSENTKVSGVNNNFIEK